MDVSTKTLLFCFCCGTHTRSPSRPARPASDIVGDGDLWRLDQEEDSGVGDHVHTGPSLWWSSQLSLISADLVSSPEITRKGRSNRWVVVVCVYRVCFQAGRGKQVYLHVLCFMTRSVARTWDIYYQTSDEKYPWCQVHLFLLWAQHHACEAEAVVIFSIYDICVWPA